jgi:hypothetical protein
LPPISKAHNPIKEMGCDLLRIFGCYFIFNEGGISWRKGIMTREMLEKMQG